MYRVWKDSMYVKQEKRFWPKKDGFERANLINKKVDSF